jgi:hypothetical protein
VQAELHFGNLFVAICNFSQSSAEDVKSPRVRQTRLSAHVTVSWNPLRARHTLGVAHPAQKHKMTPRA